MTKNGQDLTSSPDIQGLRSDSVVIPLFCRYCKERIIHDGKHWAKLVFVPNSDLVIEVHDHQELQARRLCPNAPTMVRFHVPEGVGEEKRRTHCIPEVP